MGESFLTEVDESGLSKTEWIGATEIGNFETSERFSNEQIAQSVAELPLTHLETCRSIEYAPEHPYFTDNPSAVMFYDGEEHTINIGPEDRFTDDNELNETVTRGVGYEVYEGLQSEAPEVAAQFDGPEDFAQDYSDYRHDPECLQIRNPERHDMLYRRVHSGISFGNRTTGSGHIENVLSRSVSIETVAKKGSQSMLNALSDTPPTNIRKQVGEMAEAAVEVVPKIVKKFFAVVK